MNAHSEAPDLRTERFYPMRAYVYDETGYHDGATDLADQAELNTFMWRHAKPAIRRKLEVRITDPGDSMLFWSQNGQILWPTPSEARKEPEHG